MRMFINILFLTYLKHKQIVQVSQKVIVQDDKVKCCTKYGMFRTEIVQCTKFGMYRTGNVHCTKDECLGQKLYNTVLNMECLGQKLYNTVPNVECLVQKLYNTTKFGRYRTGIVHHYQI